MYSSLPYKSGMTVKKNHVRRPGRAQRRDGLSTRNVVLEAAGRVFADRGFAEATSKEICEIAGANSAAVNYYFGGKESLYEEVLVEAHRQMVSLEDLDAIMSSGGTPEEKLRAFLARMIQTAASSSERWGIRVFLRELASPSPLITKTLTVTVLPKANTLRALVSELTGLSPESEQLQRATAFVVIPCISLIMFPDKLRAAVLPATATISEDLVEDLLTYALGGLRALSGAGAAPGK